MNEEILVNATSQETRVAVVENGIIQELHIERSQKKGIVGNIYKGRVSRVLPGMQAAFVDIGLERNGFLQSSDIINKDSDINYELPKNNSEQKIESLIQDGQEILVQVIKEPIGKKGARLTTHLAVPSRYVVLTPECPFIGVSKKIENEKEKERLKNIIFGYLSGIEDLAFTVEDNVILHSSLYEPQLQNNGGYIFRTAAENISMEEICKDIEFLNKIWKSTLTESKKMLVPNKVFEDLPLEIRVIRDLVTHNTYKIRIDSRKTFEHAVKFSKEFIPEFLERIEHYSEDQPILDLYSIEDEIQNALSRKVKLKSTGYLIIDQTEAMTTIDINTGAFVGRHNQQETIFKTNLEAAYTISRQLRLRNLGGIIIIDFIDMQNEEHRREVLRSLQKHISKDRTKTTISELTSLGLVQLTRKRTRENLEHILCEDCPTCHGKGSIKTPETVCLEIYREIMREVRQFSANKLLVIASQAVTDVLLNDQSKTITELETLIKIKISFQVEPIYTQEQFDIVLL